MINYIISWMSCVIMKCLLALYHVFCYFKMMTLIIILISIHTKKNTVYKYIFSNLNFQNLFILLRLLFYLSHFPAIPAYFTLFFYDWLFFHEMHDHGPSTSWTEHFKKPEFFSNYLYNFHLRGGDCQDNRGFGMDH